MWDIRRNGVGHAPARDRRSSPSSSCPKWQSAGAAIGWYSSAALSICVPEGSANTGLPLLRTRRGHQLVHQSLSSGRAALVTQLAILVFAPVSVLAGSTVLLHLSPAGMVRAWNQWRMTATRAASETRSRLRTPLPIDDGGFTVPMATRSGGFVHLYDMPDSDSRRGQRRAVARRAHPFPTLARKQGGREGGDGHSEPVIGRKMPPENCDDTTPEGWCG